MGLLFFFFFWNPQPWTNPYLTMSKTISCGFVGLGRCKTCENLRTSCMQEPENAVLRLKVCRWLLVVLFHGIYMIYVSMYMGVSENGRSQNHHNTKMNLSDEFPKAHVHMS